MKNKSKYENFSLIQTPITVIDKNMNVQYINDFGIELMKKNFDEVVGKRCYDLFITEHCNTDECACKQAILKDTPIVAETKSQGLGDISIKYYATPIKNENDENIGCVETIIDVTEISEIKRREEIIKQQTKDLLELSTPIIQVMEGVLAAPLIGTLDSERTQRFMEVLLNRVVETNSQIALVDITGVPIVDTQTAQHLVETIMAVKLVGAEVIVTGVRPAIAQTLVHLGINLTDIITKSSLSEGVRIALQTLERKIVSNE